MDPETIFKRYRDRDEKFSSRGNGGRLKCYTQGLYDVDRADSVDILRKSRTIEPL